MNQNNQFYFKLARLISALEKRNLIRKCVKFHAKQVKPEVKERIGIVFGWSNEDADFKGLVHREVMSILSKMRIGVESGNETLIECKIRQELVYKKMKEDIFKEYPENIDICNAMIEEIHKKNQENSRNKDVLRHELAVSIYRMISIYKWSKNGDNNIQKLNKALNCRYLVLEHHLNKLSQTGLMSEKDFTEIIKKDENGLIRAAEYFTKKGREYFTSSYMFQKVKEGVPDFYLHGIFENEMDKRKTKINTRYDKIVSTFNKYNNFY